MTYSLKGKRVWVAGHRGMAGSAIVRRLKSEDCEILAAPRDELDALAGELRRSCSFRAYTALVEQSSCSTWASDPASLSAQLRVL